MRSRRPPCSTNTRCTLDSGTATLACRQRVTVWPTSTTPEAGSARTQAPERGKREKREKRDKDGETEKKEVGEGEQERDGEG